MALRRLFHLRTGPAVLRRTTRVCIVLSCLCVVVACGVLLWRSMLAPRREAWQRYVVLALGLMPLAVIYPVGYWVQRHVRRDWSRSQGKLCTCCGYDLSNLRNRGACPECGETYDIDADAAMWAEVGLERSDLGRSR